MSLSLAENRVSAVAVGLPLLSPPFPSGSLDLREDRQQLSYLYREVLNVRRPVGLVRAIVVQADSRRIQFGD